jgi:hypothetical protein
MTAPIQVTPEELRDPKVDQEIARQQSFGFAVRGTDEKPPPLFMKPWFALMLAGALASFLAWCVTEPYVDDGIRFRGRVEGIALSEGDGDAAVFPRLITIAGAKVLAHRRIVVLDEAGETIPLEAVKEGDSIEVLAEAGNLADGAVVLSSLFMRKLPPAAGLEEPVDVPRLRAREHLIAFLLFPLMAGLIGMLLGATDGILSRAWSRAAMTSTISLGVGCLGGLLASLLAGMLYQVGQGVVWSMHEGDSVFPTGMSLLAQIMVRGVAWTIIGSCAGLGQGIAMRSRKLLLNGLVGGTLGGLLGGVLFDPINLALENVYRTGGAEVSRLVGYVVIGAAIGLMIGLVEFATREAWVRLLTGPIAGKEFVLYRNPTWIGSSPKCEIYLFKDAQVSPRHASIRRLGEDYEIEDQATPAGTLLSGQRVQRRRLHDRDRIQIGQTSMEFRLRDE